MTKPTEKKEGWGTGHPKEPITKPTELEKIINMLVMAAADMMERNGLDHCKNCGIYHGDLANKLQTLIKEERKNAVEGFSNKIDEYNALDNLRRMFELELQTLIKEERKKAVEGFSKSFDALLKSFGTDEIFTTNPIRLELKQHIIDYLQRENEVFPMKEEFFDDSLGEDEIMWDGKKYKLVIEEEE